MHWVNFKLHSESKQEWCGWYLGWGKLAPIKQCIFSEAKCENFLLSTVRLENAQAQLEDEGNFYSENVSRILDNLLEGYDNRLRPGFGGKTPHCSQMKYLSFHSTFITFLRPREFRRKAVVERGYEEIHVWIAIPSSLLPQSVTLCKLFECFNPHCPKQRYLCVWTSLTYRIMEMQKEFFQVCHFSGYINTDVFILFSSSINYSQGTLIWTSSTP